MWIPTSSIRSYEIILSLQLRLTYFSVVILFNFHPFLSFFFCTLHFFFANDPLHDGLKMQTFMAQKSFYVKYLWEFLHGLVSEACILRPEESTKQVTASFKFQLLPAGRWLAAAPKAWELFHKYRCHPYCMVMAWCLEVLRPITLIYSASLRRAHGRKVLNNLYPIAIFNGFSRQYFVKLVMEEDEIVRIS